ENVVQRALILAEGPLIDAEAIRFEPVSVTPETAPPAVTPPPELGEGGRPAPRPLVGPAPQPAQGTSGTLEEDLKSREYRRILETLAAVGGNRKEAAARLGISSRTLRYKLARMRQEGVEIPERVGAVYAYGS
ncbi:MAG: helix-turn-helix domain-containing protein, partial [Halorhodospira sp.]